VEGILRDWGIDPGSEFAGEFRLAAAEVIANVFVHGAGPGRVTVTDHGDVLGCSVRDSGQMVPLSPGDEHGRGLTIVAAFAYTISLAPDGRGKAITFTMAVPRGTRTVAA
jgi:anti-sigma regulatory factor (Ser/Thr protein kinase)